MSPSLSQRVEAVQHAAMRRVWLYGLARWFAVVVVAIALLGLGDYWLRLHEPISRWIGTVALVTVAALAFIKLALPAWRFQHSRVAAAQQIERRFPELADRLSSAIAFLGESEHDPTAGSAELRRAVVAETEALSAGLDFRAALKQRFSRRFIVTAALLVAAMGTLALSNPSAAGLAIARLALPGSELPWPRRNELAFVHAPQRLAKGDSFEIALVDRHGKPPDDVEFLWKYETPSSERVERKAMQPLDAQLVMRLDNVTHGFAYRARGGDDDTMPWTELAVVDPPRIKGLQVVIDPPAYSGLPSRTESHLAKVLVGSRLRIRGVVDQPLREGRTKSDSPQFQPPALGVAADGRHFTAPADGMDWTVERSGTIRFEFTDEHGLVFGKDTRVEVQAAVDSPPAIAWEKPAEHSFVTPRAIVPLKGSVKDDLAIRGIQLRFLRPGKSDEEQVIDIFTGPATAVANPVGDEQPLNYDFELSHLTGLSPGDVLAIRITAEDYLPQLTTTTVRRLTIITEEELAQRVATRQAAILAQLADALRLARQTREQTESLANRIKETGQIAAGEANLLQAAQHNQRQVQRLLGPEPEGAEGQCTQLLAELASNQLDAETFGRRLKELSLAIRELNRGQVAEIEQQFTEAAKLTSEAGAPASDMAARLHQIGQRQDDLIQSLEALVGTLSQWDSFARITREISQIRSDQERLAAETNELRLKAAAAATVAPLDRATAKQLAARELELARSLDKLQLRMEEMLRKLTSDDPLAAAALADALDVARRLAIGEQMRQSATLLSQFQFGKADDSEQHVLTALEELTNSLSMRRDQELSRALSNLWQARSAVQGLSQRAQSIEAELSVLSPQEQQQRRGELERLRRELQRLAEESQKLARRLQRLRAQRPAVAPDKAADAAGNAAKSASAAEAQQQAAAAKRQLEEAEQQLAQAVAEAEQQLANEQSAQVEQLIAGIVARQKNVLAETQRLEQSRDAHQQLSANGQNELRHLASEQQLLADETTQLRPRLSSEAFRFALDGASEQMQLAGAQLQRGLTGSDVQAAEQAALSRLEQIATVLQSDSQTAEDKQPPTGEGSGQAQPSQTPAVRTAELQLLKLLQQEINRRTIALELLREQSGALTPEQQQQLDALAQEQGRLADLVLGWIAADAKRPEDDLGELPEPIGGRKTQPRP